MCNLELLNQINESICGGEKKSMKSFLFEARDSLKKRKKPKTHCYQVRWYFKEILSDVINFKSIIKLSFTDETKLQSDELTQRES